MLPKKKKKKKETHRLKILDTVPFLLPLEKKEKNPEEPVTRNEKMSGREEIKEITRARHRGPPRGGVVRF